MQPLLRLYRRSPCLSCQIGRGLGVHSAVLALREPLRRHPAVFYAIALAVAAFYLMGRSGLAPTFWWKALVVPLQRCMVSLSLFAIVMLIGTLPKESWLDVWLRPVRAELSIVACILCLAHVFAYLSSFAARSLSGTLKVNVALSLAIAVFLLILLLALCATSFDFAKRRMSAQTWKKVQLCAHPFFFLLYAHLALMLLPAALRGGEHALESVVMYTVLFTAYATLRVRRYRCDRFVASSRNGGAHDEPAVGVRAVYRGNHQE